MLKALNDDKTQVPTEEQLVAAVLAKKNRMALKNYLQDGAGMPLLTTPKTIPMSEPHLTELLAAAAPEGSSAAGGAGAGGAGAGKGAGAGAGGAGAGTGAGGAAGSGAGAGGAGAGDKAGAGGAGAGAAVTPLKAVHGYGDQLKGDGKQYSNMPDLIAAVRGKAAAAGNALAALRAFLDVPDRHAAGEAYR